jgi:hypothetical protein
MQQIQLTDQLYQEMQRRAVAAGFSTVDEYITDVLTHDLDDGVEHYDHLFTPERLGPMEGDNKSSKSLSAEEMEAELNRRRSQW